MRIWIEQNECQNSGLCEVTAPDAFAIGDDDLAYVRSGASVLFSPGGAESVADVAPESEAAVAEAARECPGQCIHIVA